MKRKEIDRKLNQAFSRLVPDALETVLEDCQGQQPQEGKVMEMAKKQGKHRWTKWGAGIAAAALFAFGVGYGAFYQANSSIAATISLDVNPSIEIAVNQKERVLSVSPRNEAAQRVVGDMDFKGSTLDVAVNALIGSMLRNGYINEAANSILVSVDGSDPAKGAQIQERLTQEIDSLLQTETFSGAVLSQTISPNEKTQSLADQYGITAGKAQLIQQIASANQLYTFEDLVPLSINDLNLLTNVSQSGTQNLRSTGTASAKAYIGEENALTAALSHAQVNRDNISRLSIEMDYEDRTMVYDIEFFSGGYEYDYDISAITGEVIKYEREQDDRHAESPDERESSYIGKARAKDAALSHAGVAEGSVHNYRCELELSNGKAYYEIDFDAEGYEYDYEINALDGSVLKSQRELDDFQQTNSSSSALNSISYIGEEKAKAAALSHAGAKENGIYEYKCELDHDHGMPYYEIDFDWDGYEYEYEIDAYTGAILKQEKEQDDNFRHGYAASSGSSYIGESSAKAAALSHAGLSEGDLRKYECDLEQDDGVTFYEIEFKGGGYEYEYEIDAFSGAVLKYEKDWDD